MHLYDPRYEKYVKNEENFAFKDKGDAKKILIQFFEVNLIKFMC